MVEFRISVHSYLQEHFNAAIEMAMRDLGRVSFFKSDDYSITLFAKKVEGSLALPFQMGVVHLIPFAWNWMSQLRPFIDSGDPTGGSYLQDDGFHIEYVKAVSDQLYIKRVWRDMRT